LGRRVFRRIVLACFLAALSAVGTHAAESSGDDELTALARSRGKPVIADFGLGFCMQCRKQAATLKEVEEAFPGKVVIRMVNVVKEQVLVKRYEVEEVPTLVFLDGRGKVVLRKVGPLGFEEIRGQLSRMGVE